jgi:hypothetical protein
MDMPENEERLETLLEIIPNPARPEESAPYHIELTDVQHDRTLEADFDLDLQALEEKFEAASPEEYGAYLFTQVFEESADEAGEKGKIGRRLRELLGRVEDEQREDMILKLEIARKLGVLRRLAWEAMLNPAEAQALAADRRLAFYRDVNVDAPQRMPILGRPRVLVAVVSPEENQMARLNSDLRESGEISEDLKALPVQKEQERLEKLFDTLLPKLTYVILEPQPGKSTCEQISEALQEGEFHVLHLSSHGLVSKERKLAQLVLVDADGRYELVSEEDFAKIFQPHLQVRLVLLNACHSGETALGGTFSGLAPRLMQRVPAVIGMQRQWYAGRPDDDFCRVFYTELTHHGYVDRALQRARQRLHEKKPQKWIWSTPVLYLHLGKGRLFEPEKPRPVAEGEEARPVKTAPVEEVRGTGRKGGAGIRFGKGSVTEDLKISGRVAGRDIYEGGALPADLLGAEAGIGIDIDDEAHVKGVEIREDVAAGSIYRMAVEEQESKRFGKRQQRQALVNLLDYYKKQRKKLETELKKPEADRERLREEIDDLIDGIEELGEELGE